MLLCNFYHLLISFLGGASLSYFIRHGFLCGMEALRGSLLLHGPGGPVACCVEEPGLEFVAIPPLPPKCWVWRCEPPRLALRSLSILATVKVFSVPKAWPSSVVFVAASHPLCMGCASFWFCMFCTFLLEPEQFESIIWQLWKLDPSPLQRFLFVEVSLVT